MPKAPVSLGPLSLELRKGGTVVGVTDRLYEIGAGKEVIFDEVLVVGDLTGELEYNGRYVEAVEIKEFVGLEIGNRGARGPLWKGVRCRVVR